MSDPVSWENREGIALITIDNPPVNALGHAVRAGLQAAVEAAEADPAVRALVIAAAGRSFPAGADIREFDRPSAAPHLPELCDRVEACAKPVIAALHGTVLGGGLELALAAHVRIAEASARFGFPEVLLGLCPGAGGTQRAPRLIGAAAALELMLTGQPIGAAGAEALGLIDGVVAEGLIAAALALAADLARGPAPLPTRARDEGFRAPGLYEAAIAAARAEPAPAHLPAPGRIVDCVEAALLLPFEAGLAFERAAFEDLLETPAARALRHVFLAERRLAKMPELRASPREIARIGVIGAGRMGAGLTVALLAAGFPVTLIDRDRNRLVAGLERIADLHEAAIARGQMTAEQRDADWARLAGSAELRRLAEADLVIEATPEEAGAKAAVFAELGTFAKPGALLATTSAALDLTPLGAAAGRPRDLLALRFELPAQSARLVEIGLTTQTAADAVAGAAALARRLGKLALRAGPPGGLLIGRLAAALQEAADRLLLAGASPYAVDAALRAWGYEHGPYHAEDRIGLDIGQARRRRLAAGRAPAEGAPGLGDGLCEVGRLGQAVGAGWYRYPEGSLRGQEDAEVLAMLTAERYRRLAGATAAADGQPGTTAGLPQGAAPGTAAPPPDAAEIQRRCLLALVAEGARLVAEGCALRPSDVDMAAILALGYPRWRGGPLQTADEIGLLEVKTALAELAPEAPGLWSPPDLLGELVKNGRRFASLNTD